MKLLTRFVTKTTVGKILDKVLLSGVINNKLSDRLGSPAGQIDYKRLRSDMKYTIMLIVIIVLFLLDVISMEQLHHLLDAITH